MMGRTTDREVTRETTQRGREKARVKRERKRGATRVREATRERGNVSEKGAQRVRKSETVCEGERGNKYGRVRERRGRGWEIKRHNKREATRERQ